MNEDDDRTAAEMIRAEAEAARGIRVHTFTKVDLREVKAQASGRWFDQLPTHLLKAAGLLHDRRHELVAELAALHAEVDAIDEALDALTLDPAAPAAVCTLCDRVESSLVHHDWTAKGHHTFVPKEAEDGSATATTEASAPPGAGGDEQGPERAVQGAGVEEATAPEPAARLPEPQAVVQPLDQAGLVVGHIWQRRSNGRLVRVEGFNETAVTFLPVVRTGGHGFTTVGQSEVELVGLFRAAFQWVGVAQPPPPVATVFGRSVPSWYIGPVDPPEGFQ